jgi:uncharacterized membrane protein
MSLKAALSPVLVLCLILGALAAPSQASTVYTSAFSGTVNNGDTKSAGGCFVNFQITNGSVHVTVTSPDYSSGEAVIPAGNAYYYLNVLRIYVASVPTDSTAVVDIGKTTSSSTSTGTKVYCDTPAQNTLAGDKVSFPITIHNYETVDETFSLSATGPDGWSTAYDFNGKDIYQIYVPASSSKVVDLIVSTPYTSSIGQKTISAKIGDTTLDLYVDITSVNESADVSAKLSSQIAYIGDKIYYDLTLDNLQAAENVYKLSLTGLPENWYYMYLESRGSSSELAETVVPASAEKSLVLSIVPPYSVGAGDYSFTAVITTPSNQTITKDLTLKLKSGTSMTVNTDKLAYTASAGQAFNIDVYVTNSGSGSALTNVYPSVSAPTGWVVSSSPNSTNTIKSGETQTFVISVTPPGNIVASDYDVAVQIVSDQAQDSEDFRITIATSSYIPYIAGGIILVVLVGLVFLFRKYGRR